MLSAAAISAAVRDHMLEVFSSSGGNGMDKILRPVVQQVAIDTVAAGTILVVPHAHMRPQSVERFRCLRAAYEHACIYVATDNTNELHQISHGSQWIPVRTSDLDFNLVPPDSDTANDMYAYAYIGGVFPLVRGYSLEDKPKSGLPQSDSESCETLITLSHKTNLPFL